MTNSLSLSVVIVNWNTRDLLAGCLFTLAEAIAAANHLACETFVVDNASSDGSAGLVRARFPWVNLIANPSNAGFARANNQAMQQAQGPLIMLLNSDTRVEPDALTLLTGFMADHPRCGAAGPRVLNADGSLQVSCYRMLTPDRELWRLLFLEKLWPRASYGMSGWEIGQARTVELISGACIVLRRAALEEVGLLDESYFMYTEEVDLCYRLALARWELWWVPQARITHLGGASSRQIAQEMYLQLYRSKLHFYRKYGGTARAERFKLMLRLAYWPRVFAARAAGLVSPRMAAQAITYRRLIAELPRM